MKMTGKFRHFCLALCQYLNQPILDSNSQSIWQPKRFWYLYKIELLEKCWQKKCDFTSRSSN